MGHAQCSETNRMGQKISFAQFAFEFQIFPILRDFVAAKPIRLIPKVTWTFDSDQNFLQDGPCTA